MPAYKAEKAPHFAYIFDTERILHNIWPERVKAVAATGNTKQVAKCNKEFEALRKKHNKSISNEDREGIVPARMLAEANADIHCLVGKRDEKHIKIWREAHELAKKWGDPQDFRAAPAASWQYWDGQETVEMGHQAGPGWDRF